MKNRKSSTKKQEIIKPSLLPPILNALLSTVIPGLGQAFAREVKRGLILFMSFITSGGLLIWRIAVIGRRYDGWRLKVEKSFYLQPITLAITILFALYYLWIIVDAYLVSKARNRKSRYKNAAALLFFSLLLFFVLGWQIGQIDLISLFTQADEAVPTLSRVIWPWKAAITYPEDFKVTKFTGY